MSGRFGPLLRKDQGTTFRLWAPMASRVDLLLDKASVTMIGQDNGWYTLSLPNAGPGTRYRFRIDDDIDIPDPISHFQPKSDGSQIGEYAAAKLAEQRRPTHRQRHYISASTNNLCGQKCGASYKKNQAELNQKPRRRKCLAYVVQSLSDGVYDLLKIVHSALSKRA